MTNNATSKEAPLLNFKVDTLTLAVRRIARWLGFSETQAVHFALARLREDALRGEAEEACPPLTKGQLAGIRMHAPKRKGRCPFTRQYPLHEELTSH